MFTIYFVELKMVLVLAVYDNINKYFIMSWLSFDKVTYINIRCWGSRLNHVF